MKRPKGKVYSETSGPPGAVQHPPELDLNGAASLAGLAQEIDLLRALVKRAVQTNRDEEARRLVLALCGALRLQQALAGEPVRDERQLLIELLDQVGLEEKPPGATP